MSASSRRHFQEKDSLQRGSLREEERTPPGHMFASKETLLGDSLKGTNTVTRWVSPRQHIRVSLRVGTSTGTMVSNSMQ